MLWSKQYYYFDGYRWLEGHHANPLRAASHESRNRDWFHMINDDILSMPDKWEYPWYAAWDLGFHALALSVVDLDFAKEQLEIVLSGRYMHPPTASFLPTNGTSATSIRRCTPGRRSSFIALSRRCAALAISNF